MTISQCFCEINILVQDLVPKSVVSDSAASRKALVEIALSLLASTGTSTKDL